MSKKWVTMMELLIYIFVSIIVWTYVSFFIRDFMKMASYNNKIKNFSITYNDFIKNVYWNSYNWWNLTWIYNTWLVFYNWSGYIWYKCYWSWLWMTYNYNSLSNIDWDNLNKTYEWFTCNSLTGRNVDWWYWLDLNLMVTDVDLKLKYYIIKK